MSDISKNITTTKKVSQVTRRTCGPNLSRTDSSPQSPAWHPAILCNVVFVDCIPELVWGGGGLRGYNASWTCALGLMVSLWRAASNNVLSISGSFILFLVKPQQLYFTTLCTHDMSAPLFYLSSRHNTPFLLQKIWLWNAFAWMHCQWLKGYIIYSGNIIPPHRRFPWTLSSHFELTSPTAVLRCENQPRHQPVSSPLRSITGTAVSAALFTHSADTQQH